MPLTSIDLKFKVVDLLYADAYGETYRILIVRKRSEVNHNFFEKSKTSKRIESEKDSGDEQHKRQLYEYSD